MMVVIIIIIIIIVITIIIILYSCDDVAGVVRTAELSFESR